MEGFLKDCLMKRKRSQPLAEENDRQIFLGREFCGFGAMAETALCWVGTSRSSIWGKFGATVGKKKVVKLHIY